MFRRRKLKLRGTSGQPFRHMGGIKMERQFPELRAELELTYILNPTQWVEDTSCMGQNCVESGDSVGGAVTGHVYRERGVC